VTPGAKSEYTPELRMVKLSAVLFDEVVYPRLKHDPALVQQYADDIEQIEAAGKFISVATDMKLLDGKHRWLGYKTKFQGQDPDIHVYVYPVIAPHEQLALAVKLNSGHGRQLGREDKEDDAKKLFAYGFSYETIADALSVSTGKVSEWLSRTVKEQRNRRNRKIIEMWMACYTLDEIADAVAIHKDTASEVCRKFSALNDSDKAAAEHATEFEVPLYNVWKQQEKTPGTKHFGNSEVRWLDNLLYRYTKPFDVVVDPFAGGGSTIDVCRQRFRRYWVGDLKPIPARAEQIREHDICMGLPALPRWQYVKLIFLDPPYWRQAEGKYSSDPADLSNMPLEEFTRALASIINGFAKKLSSGAVIAMLMQPTQWNAPDKQFTPHLIDIARLVKLPIDMQVQCPYESQQCNAQMVEWATTNRQFLVLSRELVIWRVK
jgi:predicted transcriptional regulator